jgi:hypothetical protein
MRRLRHIGFLFWLALAVAMGQQAAFLHDLGHATERLSQKRDSNPAPSKCDECSLFAPFSGALGAKAPVAPFVAATHPLAQLVSGRSASLAARLAFRSRAPPAVL